MRSEQIFYLSKSSRVLLRKMWKICFPLKKGSTILNIVKTLKDFKTIKHLFYKNYYIGLQRVYLFNLLESM